MRCLEEKVTLVPLNTPLEPLKELTKNLGKGNLYIKRDDLLGHGLGGNKLRKLEYLLKEALDDKATRIVTMGGIQSNHARLTASVCPHYHLSCSLILKGERPERLTGNLLLDSIYGADIHYMKDYDKDELKAIYETYKLNGDRLYVIPMGGSTPTGTLGYVAMMRELKEQLPEGVKHLVLAAGSLGTLAGCIIGNALFNLGLTIWGIDVLGNPRGKEDLEGLIDDTIKKYNFDVTIKDDYNLLTEYLGAGYNKEDYESRRYLYYLARQEGILLDPCYTAKAFYGFLDLVETEVISPDEDALFLHTGGSPILFSAEHQSAFEKELIY